MNPFLTPDSYPSETHPGLRNLLTGMRVVVVVPMMQQLSIDEALRLWRWCNWWKTWESIP